MKRIAYFIPFRGCTRRCVYCNQHAITGISDDSDLPALEFIGNELARHRAPVELCFFGGSFAKLGQDSIRQYLDIIHRAPSGSVVTFSSYPGDFAGDGSQELIALLKKYPIGTIELGIPTLDPQVLRECRRDDDPGSICDTLLRLARLGFHLGVQMMLGLPGQTLDSAIRDLEILAGIKSDTSWDLRIYPTLVLKNTELAECFSAGKYIPQTAEEAISDAGRLLFEAKRHGFNVIRVGLLESASLRQNVIAGPYHPAFGELASAELTAHEIASAIERNVIYELHYKKISLIRGHGNHALKRIMAKTSLNEQEILKYIKITYD